MDEYTVKRFAEKEQVDQRTVYRWIQKGAVEIRRTPGGGIRILERRDPDVRRPATILDNPRHLAR